MKVYYLTNAPTPYKIEFWEEFGKYCDLTVLLEVDNSKERDKSWKSDRQRDHYTEIVMPHMFRRSTGAFCPKVKNYLKKRDGIVVVNGYNTLTGIYAIIYSKLRKIPYIISCDGGLLKDDKPLVKRIKKYLLSGASGYLSSGKVTDEYLIRYNANKTKIGNYPFTSVKSENVLEKPLSAGEKLIIRNKLKITERTVIISVGQFIYRKGFDILLKACNGMNKNIGIYIIGGEPIEEYKELVDKYCLTNVHFLHFLQPDKLRQYYYASDLFVLPTREDIWGLVVNEAMACGLPVITTTRCVSGMEMIRNGDTGILVEPDDVEGLHNAMDKLLSNDQLLRSMSAQALERAKEYTIEKMAEKTAEYLRRFNIGGTDH